MITQDNKGTGPRVLVVDDNPANVDLLVRRLARDGYCVFSLSSAVGLEAELVRIEPDVVLLDWMMPERSGVEALQGVRLLHDANRMPVIMVTARGEGDSVSEAIEAGANDYVTKPIDFTVLRSRLNGVLVRRLGVLETDLANEELEAKVAARTADLQRTNQRLRDEMAERVKAESRASRLARIDALTELPNRLHFVERLKTLAGRSAAEFEPFSLIQIDVDRFRSINSIHGPETGDAVLREIAARIQAAIKTAGLIARSAADEFSLILPAVSGPGVDAANRLRTALLEPYCVNGRKLAVSVSIALTHSGGPPCDNEALLLECDAALQFAKRTGGGELCTFDQKLDLAIRDGVALKRDLALGMTRGEIVPFYQPVVSFANGDVTGAEVLARWKHPTRGTLSAWEFIPAAEETGLVDDLFWAILPAACAEAKRISPSAMISVNLSPSQVLDQWFPQKVLKTLVEVGFPCSRLEIEMTETAVFSDMKATKHALEALRSQGVRVALDDFGVGYSSLTLLRDLPITKVKIDRSFVAEILTDPSAALLVKSIIEFCTSLGLETTAEGIEGAPVAQLLAEWGCTYGQGYWLGRPAANFTLQTPSWNQAARQVA
jgi:diguanylate cyclase (GGDEF)-like protein